MSKIFSATAALLLLSVTTASAQTPRDTRGCSRQAAMWQNLFDLDQARVTPCAGRATWQFLPADQPQSPPVSLDTIAANFTVNFEQAPQKPATATPPPKAFEYSEAYTLRRKIHFIASFATVPLFAAQWALGEKLDDNGSDSTKSAHSAVAAGIAGLFAVNSVTGVWNLWEARKDPNGRGKRLTHGLLMLAADAGFVATGMLAPDSEDGRGNTSTHRNVAITSMAISAVSYAVMLIGR